MLNKEPLCILLVLVGTFGFLFMVSSFRDSNTIENIMIIEPKNATSQVQITIEETIPIIYTPTELDKVRQIAQDNLIGKTYKLHHYDCTQFSEDLVKSLTKAGYKAQCTAGNNWEFEYTNHTWVSVWINDTRYEIEATNGEIIEQWVFDEGYYTKWKENYCW
jgi:hypothetical protein